MKFLANENVPKASVDFLKAAGYDIKSVGVENPSISDEMVMKIAIEENRTIITYDSDYGTLIFQYGFRPPAGVIFIRFQPAHPLETASVIEQIVNKPNISFEEFLTVIDANSIRQKKY